MSSSSEPYYRLGAAQSELEDIMYGTAKLNARLADESDVLKAKNIQDGVPSISSIKSTHRFPFRTEFTPVMNSANQFITHDPSTNRRFTIEYGGEFASRMYQAFDFGAGAIASVDPHDTVLWGYCDNFIASLLSTVSFKVSTDTLYEFPGHMYFVWYSLLAPVSSRPALTRCLRESCWEFKWKAGSSAMTLTTEYNRSDASTTLAMQHPYAPIQSYEVVHGPFTAYVPYNIFTLCNVRNAYPMVSVYSLQRFLEYSTVPLLSCVNIWAGVGPVGGIIDPSAIGATGAYTWTTTPAITGTRLMVEYFVVQKELQRMLALNPHGFLIRQYFADEETLTDKTVREISVTKIIESIYVLCRHDYNIHHTPIDAGVSQVTLTPAAGPIPRVFDEYHLIDPFFMPVGEKPISRLTLSARGQVFYRELDWEELSAVNQFLYSLPTQNTTINHCLGVFTFAHFYLQEQHTGSYNSGYGPNLRLQWRTQVFSQADPGVLNCVVQGLNMALFYRGTLSIRYV